MLSNFDMYKKELMSGRMDWTPMHTSVPPFPPLAPAALELAAADSMQLQQQQQLRQSQAFHVSSVPSSLCD